MPNIPCCLGDRLYAKNGDDDYDILYSLCLMCEARREKEVDGQKWRIGGVRYSTDGQ
jgi:hypothetical protein